MWAATYGYTEIVSILIQTDTNMFIKDKNDKTALDIARKRNHTQIAELIKQRMAEQKDMERERSIESTSIYDISRWF